MTPHFLNFLNVLNLLIILFFLFTIFIKKLLNRLKSQITKLLNQQNDEIVDYVPAQIVTEHIRFNPNLNIDGIVYPSTKVEGKENYVLFMDHNESLEKLNFNPRSININTLK